MADLIAQPGDLSSLLGVDVDDVRAAFLIEQAQNLCMAIVDPLPSGAAAVVLTVAARAYVNPAGATQETLGSYSVQRPGALFLTRADRRSLLNMAGRSGAFSVNLLPDGYPDSTLGTT